MGKSKITQGTEKNYETKSDNCFSELFKKILLLVYRNDIIML